MNTKTAPRDTALSIRVPAELAERIERHRLALQQASGAPVSKATAAIKIMSAGLALLERI